MISEEDEESGIEMSQPEDVSAGIIHLARSDSARPLKGNYGSQTHRQSARKPKTLNDLNSLLDLLSQESVEQDE